MNDLDMIQKNYLDLLSMGKQKEMLPFIKEALKICDQYNLFNKKIEILNDLSGVLRNIGETSESVHVAKEAIKLANNVDISRNSEAYINMVINLANSYRENREYTLALSYFYIAKQLISEELIFTKASLYNNLSLLYQDLNRLEDAINNQLMAIKILKNTNNKVQLIISYANLSEMYIKCNYELRAYKCIKKARIMSNKSLDTQSKLYHDIDKSYQYISDIVKNREDGIDISNKFFCSYVYPMIKNKFSNILEYCCFGLVGPGSECLGYDDDLSKDHDFGDRVNLFLPKKIFEKYHILIENEAKFLPGKLYLISIEDFYKMYTLYEGGPYTNSQYLRVPQDLLLIATNGVIFLDSYGEFSRIRNRLKEYYPNDVIYKKMAFSLNKMAQSGQYNYKRSVLRDDYVASRFALNEFIDNLIEFLHLINKVYMPYYKWYRSSLLKLDLHDIITFSELNDLINLNDLDRYDVKKRLIDKVCIRIVEYLNNEELSESKVDFLTYQAIEVVKNINDNELKNEDTWVL